MAHVGHCQKAGVTQAKAGGMGGAVVLPGFSGQEEEMCVFTEGDQVMPGSHCRVRVRGREAPWEAAMVFQARDGGGLGSGGGSGFGQK